MPRWMVSVIAIVGLSVAGAAGTAETAHAASCVRQGDYEVCATNPSSNDQDRTIVKKLREFIQSTKSGDRIRLSIYTWTQTGIARDLVDADSRGVDVKVVVDDAVVKAKPYEILRDAGVPVHVCMDGCMGGKINHTKFALFEIGAQRIVAQTSSNLTGSMTYRPNDLLVVRNNLAVYRFYLGFWNRMNSDSWTYGGTTWGNGDRTAKGAGVKAYAFARTDFDVVLAVLRNVTSCSDDGDGDGDGDKKIWVAASLFTGPREDVRNRLAYMEDVMGCNVKVLVNKQDHEVWAQAKTSDGYNLKNSKVRRVSGLHNKILLIDAKYNGRWQEVVFTGSHNLTGPSLTKNEESMLRIEDQFVFDQYRDYYDRLYARSTSQ